MPYIITTTPSTIYAGRARSLDAFPIRIAVATLDEATNHCIDAIDGLADDFPAQLVAAAGLGPNGGTIGPLPDGTVIAVRPTDWLELGGLAHWPMDAAGRERLTGRTRAADRKALLDAFNARS